MIKIENLSFGYGDNLLIDQLSLEIPSGGVVALIGPNGAGKSTLLQLIARLIDPREGRILVEGKEVHQTPSQDLAKLLSILPQSSNIAPRLTIRELVGFGRYPYHKGHPSSEDEKLVEEAISTFGLGDMAERFLDTLSGGQQQRALVAMNHAQDTQYMLLDEPLNNLDIAASRGLMRTLVELAQSKGKTVLIVLHDLNFATGYADRILAMQNGSVHAFGTPAAVITERFISSVFDTDAQVTMVNERPFVVV